MDKYCIERTFNEFPHMSAMILTYDLNINKVRKIVNKLVNYKCEIHKEGLQKNVVECYLKAYLINPNSIRSYTFREICNVNELISTLDDLSFEYYNAKVN